MRQRADRRVPCAASSSSGRAEDCCAGAHFARRLGMERHSHTPWHARSHVAARADGRAGRLAAAGRHGPHSRWEDWLPVEGRRRPGAQAGRRPPFEGRAVRRVSSEEVPLRHPRSRTASRFQPPRYCAPLLACVLTTHALSASGGRKVRSQAVSLSVSLASEAKRKREKGSPLALRGGGEERGRVGEGEERREQERGVRKQHQQASSPRHAKSMTVIV